MKLSVSAMGIVVCGAAMVGVACSSPGVSLGDTQNKVGVGERSTGGESSTTSTGGASAGGESSTASSGGSAATESVAADAGGAACAMAESLPSTDDAWLSVDWSNDAPALWLPVCGTAAPPNPPRGSLGSRPAVVTTWVAPHDGSYYARGWTDFHGVLSGSSECGVANGCTELNAQTFPTPPWALGSGPPGGGFSIEAKAGEPWFFWFQSLDASPPDHGNAVVNISTTSFL